tara:strand:+ start:643 stop:1620 length:978 start_codon:yes stop_codon:yes gene_type:complete
MSTIRVNNIEKRTKIIQCERCGTEFKNLRNLRCHFDRKNTCKPLLKDISIEELKEKYKVKKGCYKCENCGKEFKTSSGKCKHKKKCSINPIIIEKKENDKLKEELDKEVSKRRELEKQVEQLLLEKTQLQEANAKLVVNGNNNNSNLTTIGRDQNIIVINNFGEENIEYLLKDENFIKKCIESPINSIHKYLDNVHFNKEHPENRNIKMTNLLGPYMDYIKEGKWNKIEKDVLIPKIIDKSIDTIDEIIDYGKEDSDDDVIDYGDEDSDDDVIDYSKEISDYEKEIDDKKWKVYKSESRKKQIKNIVVKKANRQIYNKTHNIEEV